MKKWLRNWKVRQSLDDGAPLPDSMKSELRRDMAEWRRYQKELQLIQRLKADAEEEREGPSPYLHSRIMNAVRNADDEGAPASVRGAFKISWAGTLAVAAIIALAGILVFNQALSPTETKTAQDSREFQAAASQVIKIVDLAEGSRVPAWGEKLNQPLEKEALLALNDARSAVNQLARRFLPEDAGAYGFLRSED